MSVWLKDKLNIFLTEREYAGNTLVKYSRLLEKLGRYERKQKIPIYEFSSLQMHNALIDISRNYKTRQVMKSLILLYFEWLRSKLIDTTVGERSIQKITEELLAQDIERNHFFSYEDMIRIYLKDLNYVARQESKSLSEYRIVTSVIILSWYGFQLKEMIDLQRDDVIIDKNIIFKNDAAIPVADSAWKMLYEYATAEFTTVKKGSGNARIYYYDSKLFFRTTHSVCLNSANLSRLVSDFNSKLTNGAEKYRLDSILWSGRFFRAYEFISKNPRMMDGSIEDKVNLFSVLFDYKFKSKAQFQERFSEFDSYITRFK